MKVGTDSVVLGSWIEASNPQTILDIGTGCGLLALMMAQRFSQARILGVEIDTDAATDAHENVRASKWAGRIDIINADIFDIASEMGKFDLIVSNPPFFTETVHAPEQSRAIARHESNLGPHSLIEFASRHLNEDGSLCFVAPSQRDSEIELALALHKLYTFRSLKIRQRETRPIVRTFRQVSLRAMPSVTARELTVNNPDGSRTTEYSELTNQFYL